MGRPSVDLTGKRFGSLTARYIIDRTKAGAVRWYCTCECGGVHVATYQSLVRKACTRCSLCRKSKRRILPENTPEYEVVVKCPGVGVVGAMVYALGKDGQMVAFGGCFNQPVKMSNPWRYPPIMLLLNDMEDQGFIEARKVGERYDVWERRVKIMAKQERRATPQEITDLWNRAQSLGLLDRYPQNYVDMWKRTANDLLRHGA